MSDSSSLKNEIFLQIPNYLSEPYVSDSSSLLKNEIARLTREKTRLQDVLGDLSNILTQKHNGAANDG